MAVDAMPRRRDETVVPSEMEDGVDRICRFDSLRLDCREIEIYNLPGPTLIK